VNGVAIDQAGLLTTIQDEGRWGHQALGVPVSGPMDWWSHHAANILVGNHRSAATLEVTITGPSLTLHAAAAVAVTGASFDLHAGSRSMRSPAVFALDAGETLRFGARITGCRAYVGFRGGLDVPPVLGSRATDLRSGLGGVGGRALRSGDVVPIASATSRMPAVGSAIASPEWLGAPATLRFIPHEDMDDGAVERFSSAEFRVSPQSGRMAYRLEGALAMEERDLRRLSRPVAMGTIQLLPGAGPALLMADAQPTGGYPVIGAVIASDLPIAGQLAPGDGVRFTPCTYEDALLAFGDRERALPGGGMST
jgi:urea carboxylase